MLTILFACAITHAKAASWRHVPVPGAAVYDLAILPGGELYAGTDNGVYRSPDAGSSWAQTQSDSRSKRFLRLQVLDGNPKNLIAYTYDMTRLGWLGIELSLDGGASWQVTHDRKLYLGTGRFSVHPSQPNVVLFVEAGTVLRSEDGGATWAELTPGQQIREIFPVRDQPGRFVGTTYRFDRMVESNDGGITWSSVTLSPLLPQADYRSFEQDPIQPSVLYFTAYRFGSQVPTSGRIDTRTGAVMFFNDDACACSHVRVAADPHRPGRLIAPSVAFDPVSQAVLRRPLRESLDGGSTWRELAALPRKLENDYRWLFDPWQEGRIYMPTAGAGIYRSDDDGATFASHHAGMKAGVVADLSVDPRNPASFLVVRQLLPMLHTDDGGVSFSEVETDFYSDMPVAYEDRSRVARAQGDPDVLIGFDAQAFYRSTNGGRSWSRMASGFTFASVWIDAIRFIGAGSDKIAVLTQQGGENVQMHWSGDGAMTWNVTNLQGNVFATRIGSGHGDSTPVYAYYESYQPMQTTLWKSDRFGGAFKYMPAPMTEPGFEWMTLPPDPANVSRLLFFGVDRTSARRPTQIWETLDAGTIWRSLGESNLRNGIAVIDPCDGRTLWDIAYVRVSRSNGQLFQNDSDTIQSMKTGFQAVCHDGRSHLFAAVAGGVGVRQPEVAGTLLKDGYDF